MRLKDFEKKKLKKGPARFELHDLQICSYHSLTYYTAVE